jgi:hypothetical protein
LKKSTFLVLIILSSLTTAFGQKSMLDSSLTIPFIAVSYAVEFPTGDLQDRFGAFSSIGGQFGIKFKSNVYVSLKAHYLFGNRVKETEILDGIKTSEGGVIELGGGLSDPLFDMSGYSMFLSGGYVFPVLSPNPNSGIMVSGGFGILQHKIIIDFRDAQIPQLEADYKKGYDRLSNGFALNQFIGYVYFGNRKLINFYAGIDLTQAWTKNRRGYNFDTRSYDNVSRFDSMIGFRFGWMITLYRRAPQEYYYQ